MHTTVTIFGILMFGAVQAAPKNQDETVFDARIPRTRDVIQVTQSRVEFRDTYIPISRTKTSLVEIKLKDFFSVASDGYGWIKTTNARPLFKGEKYQMNRMRINCIARTTAFAGGVVYGADGNALHNEQVPSYHEDSTPVTPDSVGEIIFASFCRTYS